MSTLDVNKYCRTCAVFFEDSILVPAFEEIKITTKTNDEFQLAEEIIFLSVQIKKDDGLPQQVCINCVKQLTRIYAFRRICCISQKKLEEYFKNTKEPIISNVQLDDVKEEIKYEQETEETENLEFDVDEMNDGEENSNSSDDTERDIAEIFDALEGTIDFDDVDGNKPVLNDNNVNSNDPILTDSAYASNTNSSNVELVETENKIQCNETKPATEDDSKKQDDSRANDENLLDSKLNSLKKTVDENVTEKRWFQTKKKRRYRTKVGKPIDSESKSLLRKCPHCNYYKYSSRYKKDVNSCKSRKMKAPSDTEFYCFYCDEKFEIEKLLENHMTSIHTVEEPYNCKMCNEKFKNNNLLLRHIEKLHDGDTSKKCCFCEKTFPNAYYLRRHKDAIHYKKSYECKICLKKFHIISNFRNHIKTHDKNKQYKCRYCDKRFNQQPHRVFHEETHTNINNRYKCEKCDKQFIHRYNYRIHLRTHDTSSHICEVCGKGFPAQFLLNVHIRTIHELNTQQCEICGQKLSSQYLKKHRLIHFPNGEPEINKDRPYRAEYNMREYRNKKQEPKVRLYKCSLCNRSFDIPTALEKHMNVHDKNRQFPCDLCKTSYLKLSHLKSHINRIHSKKDTYNCHLCNKIFYDTSQRNSHVRSHKDNKSKCGYCNRMISKKYLKAHENTHVREGKYECLVCGKRFISYIPLRNHCKKHTPEQIKVVEEEIMAKAAEQTQTSQDKDSN